MMQERKDHRYGYQRDLMEVIKAKYRITPQNVPGFVYPMVQYVHETRPDYIVALDTGARIPAFAFHTLYRELYGALPTQDHSIRYRRISYKIPQERVRANLKNDIDEMLRTVPEPKVFLLDDWVNSGTTKRTAMHLFDDLSDGRVQISFGVMRELFHGVADISGDSFSIARSSWHHQKNFIGIGYSELLEPRALRTNESIELRREIAANTKLFAQKLRERRAWDIYVTA